jgi:hypothetical protein
VNQNTGEEDGGGRRIRTFETVRCQIYSLMRLAAPQSRQGGKKLSEGVHYPKSTRCVHRFPEGKWYRRWGSNPHALRRRILSPVRLPIPPLRHGTYGEGFDKTFGGLWQSWNIKKAAAAARGRKRLPREGGGALGRKSASPHIFDWQWAQDMPRLGLSTQPKPVWRCVCRIPSGSFP